MCKYDNPLVVDGEISGHLLRKINPSSHRSGGSIKIKCSGE
jgi:hypothetical protein